MSEVLQVPVHDAFELGELAHIPEANRPAFHSLGLLLLAALSVDENLDQRMQADGDYNGEKFLFATPEKVREFLTGSFFNPNATQKELESLRGFSATRGGFHQRLAGPGISGSYDRQTEKPSIRLTATSEAGSPFHNEILPGIWGIIFAVDGTIREDRGDREVADKEKQMLIKIIDFTRKKVERYTAVALSGASYSYDDMDFLTSGSGLSLKEYLALIDRHNVDASKAV